MKKKIFAIWWWEIWTGKLYQNQADSCIDQKMLELIGKEKPYIVFISWYWRSEWYYKRFDQFFEQHFTIPTYNIENIYEDDCEKDVRMITESADLIYIWWGDTYKMMQIFNSNWVSKILREKYEAWVMMAWVSAWAIIWFENGVSDSHPTQKPYWIVEWLWLIKWTCCPHYNSEEWRKEILDSCDFEIYWIPDKSAIYFEDWVHIWTYWDWVLTRKKI